jgi:hypothetical protein
VEKLAAVIHQVEPVVEKRPQRTVGIAVVVEGVRLARQAERGCLDPSQAFKVNEGFVASSGISMLGACSQPETSTIGQRIRDAYSEASGLRQIANVAQPIRDNNQPTRFGILAWVLFYAS